MADQIQSYLPDPDADPATLTYSFGGVAPVAELALYTTLSTWTRDCFGGRVRTADDLASSLDPRQLNPQTGPSPSDSSADGHARQGEGETCGVAVECAMDTELIAGHLGGYYTPTPRLESDGFLMSTGSARPLEDAFRIAHLDLVRWVAQLTGMTELDSYQLVSQTALTPIANVVDTNYTVVAKIPKSVLGGAAEGAMGGLHRHLRGLAA